MPYAYGASKNYSPKKTVAPKHSPHGGGPGGYVPPKKKTSTWTPGAGGKQHIPKTTHKHKPIGGDDWKKHATRTMQMKLGMIPKLQYTHGLGGYDFQKQFNWNPKVSSYAAALWQTPQEIARGIGKSAYDLGHDIGEGTFNLKDSWGNLKQNMSNAWDKAKKETSGNIEGILAASTMPSFKTPEMTEWDQYYGQTTLAKGGRVPFQNGGLGSLPYPEYYKLPPFSAGNTYTNTWTFPTEEEEISTSNVIPASYKGYPSYEAWLAAQRSGGDAPGQVPLGLTYDPRAVAEGPASGTTDFNINPAAFLTGKGRLDPMGSTYDNLAMMGPLDYKNFGYHMSEIPGQEGYQAPSKYFQEPSLIDKGIGSIKDFFSGLGTKKVRGTLGTRRKNQPRIPLPAAIASWSRSPFNKDSPNYNPMFEDQLNYLESLGAPGSYIGTDQTSGLLKYGPESVLAGQNVFSLFGSNNYEKQLSKKRAWFENRLNKGKKISWKNYMKTLKEQKILENKQKDDKSTTVAKIISPKHHQDVSGGGVRGKGGQGDYTTPSIHRAPKSHTAPSKTGYMGPGGKHYAQGGLASLWQR